jgi:site-specific recombinase XerD
MHELKTYLELSEKVKADKALMELIDAYQTETKQLMDLIQDPNYDAQEAIRLTNDVEYMSGQISSNALYAQFVAAKDALDRQKRFNIQTKGASIFSGDHLYFSNSRGGVADSNHVSQQIRRICKKAGIQSFGAHAFRDTFATRAVAAGMQPKTLQEILGHSDISITMNLYTHTLEERKVEEMNRINIAI